jgi:hypothetical protein
VPPFIAQVLARIAHSACLLLCMSDMSCVFLYTSRLLCLLLTMYIVMYFCVVVSHKCSTSSVQPACCTLMWQSKGSSSSPVVHGRACCQS